MTNERKKMSKTTLRKRIAVIAVSALTAGVMSAVTSSVASATHPNAGSNNIVADRGTINGSLFVATRSNTTGSATVTTTAGAASLADIEDGALSLGLLAKDTSSGTAQTATVLSGGKLSLYAAVSTDAAFTASAGSFASTMGGARAGTASYSNDLKTTWAPTVTNGTATGVATIWSAPSTAGTYTVSLLTGWVLNSSGAYNQPSTSNGTPPTLSGNITVTVVASSTGGSYSAAYSACNTAVTSAAITAGAGTAGIDSTAARANGESWYVDYDLNDAYNKNLDSGNIVVTATNGALVNIGTTGGSNPVAGTSSTDVEYTNGSSQTVRISQGTADAPVTTTVTITYNGTTVCTKTVTIAGKVAKIVVSNVGTQKLSGQSTDNTYQWTYQTLGTGKTGGSLFAVLATDSAGNLVATDGIGTFSADAATLTTTVQAISVNHQSSSVSSSSLDRYAYGSWTCGAVAGEANVKIKFTTTASGESVSSDAFKARCAGDAYTYALSFDKATYTQGEIATATVKFLDSKGFAANSITAPGANTWVLPYMTGVTIGTLASGASAAAVTKADGTSSYIFTIGSTETATTAGTYTGVVEWTALAAGTKQTPTYKIVTGGDTTTNADVLKSIVALIASINKQIQALQKLILKR
jgi:hypothetical protein